MADARGCVEQHHAVASDQERRLVDPVGDPVQVPLNPPDVVSLRLLLPQAVSEDDLHHISDGGLTAPVALKLASQPAGAVGSGRS
jgi:ABC-type Fe3+-hydroxamate transport system substrate-binding protein